MLSYHIYFHCDNVDISYNHLFFTCAYYTIIIYFLKFICKVKENIPKLVQYFNEKLRNYETEERVFDVDYVFGGKELKLDNVKEVANMSKLWGQNIQEPTFIVKNISIESIKITHKKEGFCYTTQFTHNGVCFKKVFSSQKVFDEMTRVDLLKFGRSQQLDICVLVKFKKNEKGFYYAEIQDFNSNKSNKVVF